ncbi:LptE family protein [Leptobacterium sp. I13]|uniref:LptE family protein n=1 Tax=Leptobacterium meishanense TaxID=3128904 RepID=UPI0030ED00FA
MNRATHFLYIILFIFIFHGCGVYNFTGGSTGNAKTFQVNFFQNNAPVIEPGLDRDFTLALQDVILSQTNLDLVNANGNLVYEGEIVDYRISPNSATANQTAAQNRLTIAVNVRYINNLEEGKDFERRFSFFFDYPAATQINTIKQTAFEAIFDRLTQDIFNASLADW